MLYSGATWKPVTNHGHAMTQHLGLVLHVQQGNNGLQGWFNNPASNASSTWWVSKTGACEQYVDSDLQAWAQASGNATYNSVETEGYDTEALTEAQINGLAALYKWGHDTYGWPYATSDTVGQKGFAWHGMGGSAWGNHPACPGDLRKNARPTILQIASGGAIQPPQPPLPAPGTTPAYPGTLLINYIEGHGTATWQDRMRARGWSIHVDDKYGPQSENVCRQFQSEKHLLVDGIVGPQTWEAAWVLPIT